MSAFICSQKHIKALAIFATYSGSRVTIKPRYLAYSVSDELVKENLNALDGQGREEIASYYANLLYQENIKAVLIRYPNDTLETAPGEFDKPPFLTVYVLDVQEIHRYNPVEVLKLCDSYDYQSCEDPEYYQSAAQELIQRIRKEAIRQLPGYEEAEWEI